MLEALLGTKNRELTLQYLLVYEEGYAREIAKYFDTALPSIQNQLKHFEENGLVLSKMQGRTKVYFFNPRYAFLQELTSLLDKARLYYKPELKAKLEMQRRRPRRPEKPLWNRSKIWAYKLGSFICSVLKVEDIHVVLSGGSCVEIYSRGEYTSWDLDLINQYNEQFKKIHVIMNTLGFKERDRYFVHEDTKYFIEFPSGPLGVGDAPVEEIAEIETEAGVLRLLTPTDCIKDRLAVYYHWNDEQCLQQAIWVAKQNDVDLQAIKEWSINEGSEQKYEIFYKKLKKG